MSSNNAIEARNLTKHYGDFSAVDHISFNVRAGEIFGFLGPNGAGKSTTIRMLTGVSTPTEGTATIFGYDIVKQPVKAKSVMGIIPDISNVYTELTAWENLDFTGKLYGVPKVDREERIATILTRFDLYDRRKDKVEEFSRGMRRRICIAMALIHDSRVLFLDEPTAGLDVKSVRGIRKLIQDLNEEGLTIFLTTHNIEEASQMCDRVAIINRGRIAAIDTPERMKRAMKSSQAVELSLKETNSEIKRTLESLPTVMDVLKRGDKVRLITKDPSKTLLELSQLITQNGLVPLTLNTVAPSLEDVFLQLTGTEMKKERIQKQRRPNR